MPRMSHWMRITIVALVWLGLAASAAHAHGGIAGPDELGPPVIISADHRHRLLLHDGAVAVAAVARCP